MRRMPIRHRISPLTGEGCPSPVLCGIRRDFSRLSLCDGQVAYVLLTRAPVAGGSKQAYFPAAPRLACVKPVASVHPEPGSNSSLLFILFLFLLKSKGTRQIIFILSVLCRCGASLKAPQVSGWLIDFFPLVELTSGIFSFKNDSCTVFLSIVILSMFSFTLRFQEAFPLKSGAKLRPFYLPCKPFKTFFRAKMFDFPAKITLSPVNHPIKQMLKICCKTCFLFCRGKIGSKICVNDERRLLYIP